MTPKQKVTFPNAKRKVMSIKEKEESRRRKRKAEEFRGVEPKKEWREERLKERKEAKRETREGDKKSRKTILNVFQGEMEYYRAEIWLDVLY